ncbi:sensor domain-containing protein [Candidatus Mycobacterium wuenschmannii]|uniref:Sensor domain-containing protein n=1 Tax=Candidatus Mycobacterium wuenschmannii TaxID=3027808 RepID=A0ABY8VXZ6_9MYCO|nr:sensor domain-containing protein [Candidatus Mycobacterium wuenschmannii]WIM88503.1 sensor domain-containing protein [Candidatus Mycobacterium wuenschmannii]
MRLIPQTVTIAAVVVAALWTQSPLAGASNVPPGRIVSLIPSDDEVSQYVGLQVRHDVDPLPARPWQPEPLSQRDDCRKLFATNDVDAWGSDYSAFRTQTWTVPGDPTQIFVGQSVGIFADAGSTRNRFDAAYNPNFFRSCDHAIMQGGPVPEGFSWELYDFKTNDDVMIWTIAARNWGEYTGYNCVAVAFRLGNVMSISSVGQMGNPSQAVKRLTDYILSRAI